MRETEHLSPVKTVCDPTFTVSRKNKKRQSVRREQLSCTDWESLKGPEDNNSADTMCSCINFCEWVSLPTKTIISYNNYEPWFTKQLQELRRFKEQAFREDDTEIFRLARQNQKAIESAREYKGRLDCNSSVDNHAAVWNAHRTITNYTTSVCYRGSPFIVNSFLTTLWHADCPAFVFPTLFLFVLASAPHKIILDVVQPITGQ